MEKQVINEERDNGIYKKQMHGIGSYTWQRFVQVKEVNASHRSRGSPGVESFVAIPADRTHLPRFL